MRQPSEMIHVKFINDLNNILNTFEAGIRKDYKEVIPDDIQYHIKTIRERISSYSSNTKTEDIAELNYWVKDYVSKMIGFFSFFSPLKPLKQKLQYVINQKENFPANLLKSENQFLSLKISDLDKENSTLSKKIALYERSVNLGAVEATKQLEDKESEYDKLLESKEQLAKDLNESQQKCIALENDKMQLIEENKKLKMTLIALKKSHEKLDQTCKTLSDNNLTLNNKVDKLQTDFDACPIKNQNQLNEVIEKITNKVTSDLEKRGAKNVESHHNKTPEQQDSDAPRTSPQPGFFVRP
jgi:DNA repair exonuclease SbcCD ATPase subunit